MSKQLSKCVIMIKFSNTQGTINESLLEVPSMDRRAFEKGISNLAKHFGVGKRRLKKHMHIMWGLDMSDCRIKGEPISVDEFEAEQEVREYERQAELEADAQEQSTGIS